MHTEQIAEQEMGAMLRAKFCRTIRWMQTAAPVQDNDILCLWLSTDKISGRSECYDSGVGQLWRKTELFCVNWYTGFIMWSLVHFCCNWPHVDFSLHSICCLWMFHRLDIMFDLMTLPVNRLKSFTWPMVCFFVRLCLIHFWRGA